MENKIKKLEKIISEYSELEKYIQSFTEFENDQDVNSLIESIIEAEQLNDFFTRNLFVKTELQLLLNKYSKDSQYLNFKI